MNSNNHDVPPADRNLPVIANDQVEPGTWRHRATNPPSAQQTVGLSPALVLNSLVRWWKVALPTGLVLAAAVAAVLVWQFEPEYSSYAILEIEDLAPFVAFKEGGANDGKQYIQTQVELLRSPVVLEPALAKVSLREIEEAADPIDYLQEHLSVQQIGKSELYRIEFTAKSRQGAMDVVTAVISEYFAERQEDDFHRSERVIELLEEQRTARKLIVERLRENVVKLTKEVTGLDPYTQQAASVSDAIPSTLASISNQLVEAEVRQEELKAQIRSYEETSAYVLPRPVLDMQVTSRPEVMALQQEIEQIRAQLDARRQEQLSSLALPSQWRPEQDQQYQQLQATLELREAALESSRQRLRRQVARQYSGNRQQERAATVAELRRQLLVAQEKYTSLRKQYEEHLKQVKTGGATGVELEFSRAELAREERVFDLIAARKLALQVEQRAPARIKLRRAAAKPVRPVAALPFKPLAAGCLAGLLLPFGLAVGWEVLARRISNPAQLQDETHLPVVGEVARYPMIAMGSQHRSLSRRARRSLNIVEECIDGLRTTLVLTDDLKATGVLTITSAASGEGKTTISCQLAQSIARSHQAATLLIDGDMRSPDVHRAFELPLRPGLAEVLAGTCELEDAIHQINGDPLFVLCAGEISGSPHDHVQSSRIEGLLDVMRQKFPHVVIDSPPVLSASESMVFARYADSVLVCCMRDVSRVFQVKAAVERLTRGRANLCGTVLSGVSVKSYVYRYGGYAYADPVQQEPAAAVHAEHA